MTHSSQPDITKQEHRFYWLWILPVQTMLMTSFIMPVYGFNAFIKPINQIFDPSEILNGWPGAISGGLVFLGMIFGAIFERLLEWICRSAKCHFLLSNMTICLSLIISAFACWNQSLWLLLVGGSLMMGMGVGCCFSQSAKLLLSWGRQMGHLGLQSGVYGLWFGLWGALYSLLAPMIIDHWGLAWTLLGTSLFECECLESNHPQMKWTSPF